MDRLDMQTEEYKGVTRVGTAINTFKTPRSLFRSLRLLLFYIGQQRISINNSCQDEAGDKTMA